MKSRWKRNWLRLTALAFALGLVIGLAACGETYKPIRGTNYVIVRDGTNSVDARNLRVACAEAGFANRLPHVIGRTQDGNAALIECRSAIPR